MSCVHVASCEISLIANSLMPSARLNLRCLHRSHSHHVLLTSVAELPLNSPLYMREHETICPVPHFWKAAKEYLNHRGTKSKVFRVCFLGPLSSHPFSLISPPSFPLQAPTTSPLTSPLSPSSLTPRKLRFRYPSDLGTLLVFCSGPADIF